MTQYEKAFNFLRKPWVMVIYVFLVVLAYYFIDRFLATYFFQLDIGIKMPLLKVFSVLGQWIVSIVLLVFLGLYFRYVQINSLYEARIWYLLACVVIANFMCFILKVSLSRARPDLLFSSHQYGFYWFKLSANYWSFPSGHTTTVTSLAVGLGVLFPRYFYAVLVAAFLVAASRIILFRHYLSDVLGAFYITMLVVHFFTEYLKTKSWFKKMGNVV